jgi:hypothetical protein
MAVRTREPFIRDAALGRLEREHHADLAGLVSQVRALAMAVEQLADAVDLLSEDGAPTAFVDEHVEQARVALRSIW